MKYEFDKVVAVSGDDHKSAALFFDKIIPYRPYVSKKADQDPWKVPSSVKPRWLTKDTYTEIIDYATMGEFLGSLRVYHKKGYAIDKRCKDGNSITIVLDKNWVEKSASLPMSIAPESEETKSWYANKEIFFASHFINQKKGIPVVPIFSRPSNCVYFEQQTCAAINIFEVLLSNIKGIDTTRAEWKQIVEFRTDKDSVRKLRNLRLFLFDNYLDKDSFYIRDSIDNKLEQYEAAIKKHGFDMIETSLSQLMESRSLVGLATLSAAAVLAGYNESALFLALGGAIVETSKLVIKVIRSRYDMTSFKNSHELAYIIWMKDEFPSRKKI